MIAASRGGRREAVIQGEFRVSGDARATLTSILGSCVAACIYDAEAGVGGMNHFLLPGEEIDGVGAREGYGVHLMELLINGVMKLGGRRARLEAKIFGGARVVPGLSDIGRQNAAFAERFLTHEGVPIVAQDVGGPRGRRVQFHPATGRARLVYIARDWRNDSASTPDTGKEHGDVELFAGA